MNKKILLLFTILLLTLFTTNVKALAENKDLNQSLITIETSEAKIFIIDENSEFAYSWRFPKSLISADDFNFSLKLNYESPVANKIKDIYGKDDIMQYLSFEHHGSIPGKAIIKVPFNGKLVEGKEIALYYYNDITNKIELVNNSVDVANGYAQFSINHCSDYFLAPASIVTSAMKNSKNMGVIIVIMILIVAGLVGYTLFKKK